MMDKKKAAEAARNKNLNRKDTSASNARAIIIQALRTGPQTTIDLRERWGVMAPAPRVLELKVRGYVIASVPVSAFTADGVQHRGVARYVLLSEPKPANDAASASKPAVNDSDAGAQP
jgi:Helix-turn-helix domain